MTALPDAPSTNSQIVADYCAKTPASAKLAAEAHELFPSGVTHDGRYLEPYGVYVTRGEGAYKWDVDGNRYIDFFGGHGALLLGHNRPEVVAAVQAALQDGTHFGANQEREVRWAQLVKQLIPSAERVRFTSSGTEATHMALRLARAFTGRRQVIRLKTHFHGWHDHMTSGYNSHFGGEPTVGVLPGVAEGVVLLPPNDLDAVAATLEANKDIAAMILEPTGGSFGMVPVSGDYLQGLRDLTQAHGALLIFDEVVTGFRVSRGGAQAHYGVTPDMTTLAKILAGGLPGGAVVGRKDILDTLDFAATKEQGREKIAHPGTFNANPVSAAAGIAALQIIADTDACERANTLAASLRGKLNAVLAEEKVNWAVYGTFSGFHIFTNSKGRTVSPADFDPGDYSFDELKTNPPGLVNKFRIAMLLNGADFSAWPGGLLSAAHSEADLDQTAESFREVLRMLRKEEEI